MSVLALLDSHTTEPDPLEITATELWSEFRQNGSNSKAKYDGTLLIISGQVAEVSESFMGQPCILLENGEDSVPDGIFCFFPVQSAESVVSVEVGNSVTVLGVCSVAVHIAGEKTPFISIESASFIT